MNCRVCKSITKNIFKATILEKYYIKYYYCANCGFLQTEDPYWLKEVYQEAINPYDTGIISRNIQLSRTVSIIIYFLFNRNGKFLDYAGGYGFFTRIMRDTGFDFYWIDQYSQNLTARGFEYNKTTGDIELITTFECFEHFTYPIQKVEKMLSISKNILFTTILLPREVPKPDKWWYYAPEHGQHISFYSDKTLKFIAQKYGLYYYSFRYFHLFTEKKFKKNTLKFFNLLYKSKFNYQIETFLFNRIKRKMKSRTHEDMNYIISLKKIKV